MIREQQQTLSQTQIEIIRAVLYFDVFSYPLKPAELYENSAVNISPEEFTHELDALIKDGYLKAQNGFILNPERNEEDIARRLKGNAGAASIMQTAYRYSRKIASFPFVEGVLLSGGLSKNYYDEKGDIDFFIITKPGRLWICRALLIIRYKLLPKSRKKFWCTNYFISSDNLMIPDRNVFTGTELAYLIPTVNYTVYRELLGKNNWYKPRFPNKKEAAPDNCIPATSGFLKQSLELLLKGGLGSWLDTAILNYTLNRWRKKYPAMSQQDFDLQFRSRKDVCKRHTLGFQNKVLVKWEKKTSEFEQKFNTRLAY